MSAAGNLRASADSHELDPRLQADYAIGRKRREALETTKGGEGLGPKVAVCFQRRIRRPMLIEENLRPANVRATHALLKYGKAFA